MKQKPAVTLDRVLSRFGLGSRTEARAAVLEGRLKVNGRVVRDPDFWVQPGEDAVHLDGQRLKAARSIVLLLYKPKGVITSHGDPQGRPTVYDCLGDLGRWVVPVGRLDMDTSGLLLLTNDTALSDFITRPQSCVPKTYRVKLNGLMPREIIARLEAGVEMKRGDWARPLSVRRLEDRGKYTWLEVVLTEGKNREVRRMIEAVGFQVLKLVRTGIGALTLKGLEVGAWRRLSPEETAELRRSGRSQKRRETVSAARIMTAQTATLQILSN
ncbi:MAG: pseudouridine synthase [Terriglobia bacterium]